MLREVDAPTHGATWKPRSWRGRLMRVKALDRKDLLNDWSLRMNFRLTRIVAPDNF